MGVEPALDVAHRLLRESGGELWLGGGALRLSIDLDDARRTARARLADAVERIVEIPRGRPSTRRRPQRNG